MNLPIIWDRILLPAKDVDLGKFCVVACDQYTANPGYWDKLSEEIGDSPSTLRMILPEVYLGQNDTRRTLDISKAMGEYIAKGYLGETGDGVIVVERTVSSHIDGRVKTRRGIMLVVDLEQYSFVASDNAMIRATEGTVIERVPPRAAVREACELEFPHIMLLVDDPKDTLIAPVAAKSGKALYDVELNAGGGRLVGKLVDAKDSVEGALGELLKASIGKYGHPFLFGVGDGNHSLAAAKAVWQKTRNPKSRYALCEVVNIYDSGLEFEPIHRVVMGTDIAKLHKFLLDKLGQDKGVKNIIVDGAYDGIRLDRDAIKAVASVQQALDEYVSKHGGVIDYIHGKEELSELSAKGRGNLGILLPAMSKDELFPYCATVGALPRKTFSMGEAYEKRYYLEGRRIR